MNVFLILEDALRPDHLGCYGYPCATSPAIDRLAREGVVFRNAIATASHTLPPIVSLLMSQWACTHGVVSPKRFEQWIASERWRNMDTPLRSLERNGVLIDGEMVTRWKPLGFTRDTDGEKIGEYFERYRDGPWFFMAEPYPTHLPYNPPEKYYRMFLEGPEPRDARALERLGVVRSCLIVHPTGVVSKLEAGESDPLPDSASDAAHKRTAGRVDLLPEDAPTIRALYDGEVRVFDDMVARWVEALEKVGALDDTLIVITADHGEELMERGHVGHSSCNLKGTLYDESIKVPMILRYPPRLPRGRVVDEQISHVDLMPTIFDLFDLPLPAGMEGFSLLSLASGTSREFRQEAYAETLPAGWQALERDDREMFCVRTAGWKMILRTSARRDRQEWELYDLASDPAERENLYREDHPQAVKLKQSIESYLEKAAKVRF
jgi:arylsulfatase A-like enzyme